MKVYKLSILAAACSVLAASGFSVTKTEFDPLVSSDSRNCFADAQRNAGQRDYQPALAKLESLLMAEAVPIAIDEGSLPADAKGYEGSVEKGIQIWRDALPDCPYRIAKVKERPAVLVKFVKQLDERGGDLQGMIRARHEFRWSGTDHTSTLTSTLYVVYKCDGRNLSHSEASEVVAHELGHLLGLTDAPDAVGLMGPFVAGQPRLQPSTAELQALKQFRGRVRDEIDKIEDLL